jgi:hypothetical protein
MPKLTRRRLLRATAPAGAPLGLPFVRGGHADAMAHDRVARRTMASHAGGSIAPVAVEVGRCVARLAPGGLRSGWAARGYLAGAVALWTTGLLVG